MQSDIFLPNEEASLQTAMQLRAASVPARLSNRKKTVEQRVASGPIWTKAPGVKLAGTVVSGTLLPSLHMSGSEENQ